MVSPCGIPDSFHLCGREHLHLVRYGKYVQAIYENIDTWHGYTYIYICPLGGGIYALCMVSQPAGPEPQHLPFSFYSWQRSMVRLRATERGMEKCSSQDGGLKRFHLNYLSPSLVAKLFCLLRCDIPLYRAYCII